MPKTVTDEILDQTAKIAEKRSRLQAKIDMVEHAAVYAGEDLSNYILKGITEGIAYTFLQCRYTIPCNRNEYYDRYRKFFWILDRLRE